MTNEMNTKRNSTTLILQIFAILTIAVLKTASTLTNQVFALKRYFNCMTDLANKSGKLTLDDVNSCYDNEFHNSGSQGSLFHSSSIILQILPSQLPITRY